MRSDAGGDELLRQGGRPGRERPEQDRDRWAAGEGLREDVPVAAAVGADYELVEAGGDGVKAMTNMQSNVISNSNSQRLVSITLKIQ